MNMTDNRASTDRMPIATTAGGDAGTLEVGDKKLAALQNIFVTFISSLIFFLTKVGSCSFE